MSKMNYYRFLLKYLGMVLFKRATLGKVFEKQVGKRGGADCIRFEDQVVTYDALNRRANRRAHYLKGLGIGKGDSVALMMENRVEFLETVVALAKLGGSSALINHNLKGASLAHCVNISEAKQVIVGRECLPNLQEVLGELSTLKPENMLVDTHWPAEGAIPAGMTDLNAALEGQPEGNIPHPPLNSKDVVLYIYTSGTTGLPKAARVNHYRWYAAGLAMGTYGLAVKPEDTVHVPLPLYHSNGILIGFGSAMANGACFSLSRRFSASGFWAEVAKNKATCFIYIGELLRYLVNRPPAPEEKQHQVTRCLGNGLRPDIWDAFQQRTGIAHIREFYAATEGNAVMINMNDAAGSIGTPVLKASDNTAVVRYDVEKDDYPRDAQGFCIRCQPDEVGELLGQIKATTPYYGYTSKEASEKKILRDVFKKGDAFFKTGDLVTKDAAGNFYFVDRIGDTFRWKGENVSTQEIQELLSSFPGIEIACVYGVPLPGAEGRVGMGTVVTGGAPLDGKALYAYVNEQMPTYAQPAFVRVSGEMDMTGTFKLRKTDLQEQGYDIGKIKDAVYYLNREAASYEVLDTKAHKKVLEQQITF